MKKCFFPYYYIIIISLFMFSCKDYLEPEVITDLNVDQITREYTYSRGRVASIYSDVISELTGLTDNSDGSMSASASDEAEFTLETSSVQLFNRGSWNQYQNPGCIWAIYYRGIRKVNQLLISCDSIDLEVYRLNPDLQVQYQSYLTEINRWKCEARFLRAYFYFELIKRYGGVPLITSVASLSSSLDEDFKEIQRNTLEACIKFIVDECDATAAVLPENHAAADLGRVTKVAALALKSRVLLYAASELFNNPSWASGYSQPELISLTGDRQARWRAAADAAKNAIDVAVVNNYSLSTNYSDLFGANAHSSREAIFFSRRAASNNFEMANVSVGFDRGNSGNTPTQNLVDVYEMRDGSKFNWNNPEHAANPYANRDPRLALTIATNNSTFKGRPLECWEGGRDGFPIRHATKTGYYLRKYINEGLDLVINQTSVHSWVIFRLAELYLNYAEALNEIDPGNSEIKLYFDKVRERPGIMMPGLQPGSQSEVRTKIYSERQVEFAFEDHRLWDARRWMIASSVFSSPVKGVKITRGTDNQFTYSVIDVESRVFLPKMYLYPIPQNDIYVAGKLIQNPLW